jgi:hypothetical protein
MATLQQNHRKVSQTLSACSGWHLGGVSQEISSRRMGQMMRYE